MILATFQDSFASDEDTRPHKVWAKAARNDLRSMFFYCFMKLITFFWL